MTERGVQHVLRRCAVVLLVVFAVIAGWVMSMDRLPADRRALVAIHESLGTSLDQPLQKFAAATDLAPLSVMTIVATVTLVVLVGRRHYPRAGWFALAVGVVWLVNPMLKRLVGRERPDVRRLPDELSEYSFPSGHAADTMALGAALVMVAWCTRWRRPVLVGSVVVVALVGFAQLELGRHHPVDIVAGWLWAAGWVLLVWSWRLQVSERSAAR
jgi:undecaprenyl-diphosphatase